MRQRLEGALASLPLSLRRVGDDAEPVRLLRASLKRRDWAAFEAQLSPLLRRHPFAAAFLALPATPQRIAAGGKLHRGTCAGCHEADWSDVALPAKNLHRMAQDLPRGEFAARLWLGVRGTRETAYANPFTDEELASLMAYYTQVAR